MDPLIIAVAIAVLICSVVIHEVSHGVAALALGDRTALQLGRLTLNPLAHLDPFGSIVVPLITSWAGIPFGWAKPVPYNPYNLRDQKYGPAIVALAGPLSNIALALIFGLFLRFFPFFSAAFGPDGFRTAQAFAEVFFAIIQVNLTLAVFNLVPVPPLDGSKVLFAALPYRFRGIEGVLERYSIAILVLFVLFGFSLIHPIIDGLFRLIVGVGLGR